MSLPEEIAGLIPPTSRRIRAGNQAKGDGASNRLKPVSNDGEDSNGRRDVITGILSHLPGAVALAATPPVPFTTVRFAAVVVTTVSTG